ncbi:cell cycle checkpoint protein RAD1-like [Centruroides sculpturatus]|uniref:cell cycle checkpoint protein RAD1-like n=2 Tax=Centruroides sculpturatus TaxID=218467 RepID=UPI000C6EE155|nr:cell cycle checkpoint protein RAD1-like [Centruroides sculpturatus]
MSQTDFTSQDNADYALVCSVDNARNISQLLKAIHFGETATLCASKNGLKVTVEESKCVQANAYIQAVLFHEYNVRQENVTFKINLNVLLECLNIFGNSNTPGITTALKMCYGGYGSSLILALEEEGVLTDCHIHTQEPENLLNFDFSTTNIISKVIMKSEVLKEVWNDLDLNSEILEITISPNTPNLRFSTVSNLGTINLDFSKDSDMIETFTCLKEQTNRYKISLLKPSFKALIQSAKISIRNDDQGFLCLQYMIKVEDGQTCFVEYFCAPEEDTAD